MSKVIDNNDAPVRGAENIPTNKKEAIMPEINVVNVPEVPTLNLPVDDLGDVVDLYYKGWETYQKVMADGVITSADLVHLVPFGMLLPAVFSGFENVLPQAKDLTDEEMALLINKADGYELGDYYARAKGLLKFVLTGAQTASLF